MFKMKSEIGSTWEENPAGGSGKLKKNLLVEPAECPTGFAFVNLIELQSQSAIGVHLHQGSGEIYWFLQGEGEYCDNGTTRTIRAGDVAICYDGQKHGVVNCGKEVMRFLAIKYVE